MLKCLTMNCESALTRQKHFFTKTLHMDGLTIFYGGHFYSVYIYANEIQGMLTLHFIYSGTDAVRKAMFLKHLSNSNNNTIVCIHICVHYRLIVEIYKSEIEVQFQIGCCLK